MVACERMPKRLDPFRFLLISVSGWMNQQQRDVIEYLREKNRVLRTQFGNRRIRFTDDQRRSLAPKAKLVGRKLLSELSTIVTPETLLRWHRDLSRASTTEVSAAIQADRLRARKSKNWLFVWHRKTAAGVTYECAARRPISATK
jgi:hypothetical protein